MRDRAPSTSATRPRTSCNWTPLVRCSILSIARAAPATIRWRMRAEKAWKSLCLEHIERVWADPDEGLWEFRSGRRQFTQSKVMAWMAFDRCIRMVEEFGMKGPVERWMKIQNASTTRCAVRVFIAA